MTNNNALALVLWPGPSIIRVGSYDWTDYNFWIFSLCLIIPYYLINTNFMAEDTSISISLSREAVMKNFYNCFFST